MSHFKTTVSYLSLAFFSFAIFVILPFFLTFLNFSYQLSSGMMAMMEKSLSMVVIFVFCITVSAFLKDRDFHFSSHKLFSALVIGFLGFLIITIIVSIWEKLTQDSSSIALIRQLGIGTNSFNDLWLIFAIALFGPIAEELTFRWLIYTLVKKAFNNFISLKFSIIIATIISSWAFMEIHGADEQTSQLLALFIVGVILALTYEVSSSIFAPIFAHCLNNALALYQNTTQAHISFASNWLLLVLALLPFASFFVLFLMQKIFYLFPQKHNPYI